MPILKPAVSYARISQKVERDKVADQHAQNERHAAARGYHIVKRYTDDGIGALGDKVRPGFERMLTDAEQGDFEVIVATEEERLARNVPEKIELHSACEAAGVVWDTIRDGYVDPSTDSGEFMSTIRAAVGRIESRRKTRRQRAASDLRAAEGIPNVGNVGYGYRRDDDRVVLVTDEASVIREAARRVLDGESLRGISKNFNERGILGPGKGKLAGKPWNSTTLKQLLLRPSLAGLRKHRGVIVGNMNGEAVFDTDTRDRLLAVLTDPVRRTGVSGRTPKYLLGGIARCGRCDGVMVRAVGRMARQPNGNTKRQPPSYVCSECYRVRRKQELVDALVEGILVGRLQMPDAAQLFARGDPAALREARDAVEAIDARLANAADMFAAGDIDATQLMRITERLRSDRARTAAAVEAALPAAVPADLIGDRAAHVWADLSMDSKRAVLDTLVTVTVLPSGSGKAFDPSTVRVDWKS